MSGLSLCRPAWGCSRYGIWSGVVLGLAKLFYHANFYQLLRLFWSACSWVVTEQFQTLRPPSAVKSTQTSVHGTLANHHPAIIAQSLHNVGPRELTFLLSALLSCELSVANKHIIGIMFRPETQLTRLRTIKWRDVLLCITSIIPIIASTLHPLTDWYKINNEPD